MQILAKKRDIQSNRCAAHTTSKSSLTELVTWNDSGQAQFLKSIFTVPCVVLPQERKVAVDSLRSVAGLLTDAYSPLHDIVFGRNDVPENHGLDAFFSIVKATSDVRILPSVKA